MTTPTLWVIESRTGDGPWSVEADGTEALAYVDEDSARHTLHSCHGEPPWEEAELRVVAYVRREEESS